MKYILAILIFITSISFGQLPAGRYLKVKDDGSGFELFTLNAVTSTKLADTSSALRLWVASTYQTALGFTPQSPLVSGTTIKTINGNSILTSGNILAGYTLPVQALTSSPTDAQTIYFGGLPKSPVTVAATSKIYIRKAGTIKIAEYLTNLGEGSFAPGRPHDRQPK